METSSSTQGRSEFPPQKAPPRWSRLLGWAVVTALVAGLMSAPDAAFAQEPAPATPPAASGAVSSGHYITVYGEVGRPGKYLPVAGEMVSGVILRAGGFSTKAKDKAVKVVRKVPGKGNVTLVVNVRDVLSGRAPGKDLPLLPNDTVIVEERLINF